MAEEEAKKQDADALNSALAVAVYDALEVGTDDALMLGGAEDGDTLLDGHFRFDQVARALRIRLEALGFKAPLE